MWVLTFVLIILIICLEVGITYFGLIFFLIILIIYLLVDISYFVRVGILNLISQFFKTQNISIFDTAVVRGICFPKDLGGTCSMNAYKYVQDIQMAIHDFYIRTGLNKVISEQKNNVYQNSTNIRYIKPIICFSIYRIKTQLIDWDARHIYLVHYFVTGYNEICTVAFTRQVVLIGTAKEVIQPLYDTTNDTDEVEEVSLWKEVLESSVNLAKINEDLLRKHAVPPKRGRSRV